MMVDSNSKHPASSYLAVLALAAAFYVISCAPGSLWQDSGMFQYRVWHNDIKGGLGLALAHPLYHIIGAGVKYIPIGEFGYRVNVISAVSAAIAIANLFLLLRLWVGRNLPAAIGAITLAFSWTFWQHASIAEVYTLYAALFTAELIFLSQYLKTKRIGYLYLLGLFNGLAIANHMWGTIPFACYVVFLATLPEKRRINFKNIAVITLLWIVGAGPYEYLIVAEIIRTGDITGTLYSTLFGNSWSGAVFNTSITLRIVLENIFFLIYNFPTPNILFLFIGIFGLYKVSGDKRFAHIMLVLLILFFVFAFRYTVPDRYAFFIPFYCLASVLIGVGIDLFVTWPRRRILTCLVFVLALLPIPVYIIAPAAAQKMQFNLSTRADVPYRNDYVWFLRPWKTGYRGAEKFADEVFKELGPDAVVYADNTMVYPLLYMQQVRGKRADIKIISEIVSSHRTPTLAEKTIEQWLSEGDVYSVSPVNGRKQQRIVWKIGD